MGNYACRVSQKSWSNKQLKRLGNAIRNNEEPSADLPDYDEVMMFYNDVALKTQSRLQNLDWEPLLGARPIEITSRSKTLDTLRQKLQRKATLQLPSVQDIAGVRFEAEMTLDEQDIVTRAIAGMFDHDTKECSKDLREKPQSGYRALHLRLDLECRVEVQVRTHLQGKCANMYEAAADLYGRDIRYDSIPEDRSAGDEVRDLHGISERIAVIENARNRQTRSEISMNDFISRHPEAQNYESIQSAQKIAAELSLKIAEMEEEILYACDRLKNQFNHRQREKQEGQCQDS
ncbi:hypothetical protein GCM10027027_02280 [Neomicrococcus lactis]